MFDFSKVFEKFIGYNNLLFVFEGSGKIEFGGDGFGRIMIVDLDDMSMACIEDGIIVYGNSEKVVKVAKEFVDGPVVYKKEPSKISINGNEAVLVLDNEPPTRVRIHKSGHVVDVTMY